MEGIFHKKGDRLSDLCAAALFLILLSAVWLCGTVRAGEGQPVYRGFYQEEDGTLYYFDRYGKAVTESFVTIVDRDGEYSYYFLEDGRAAEGLTQLTGGSWYYFEENHVMLVSGIRVLENKTWYFGPDGKADWVLEKFE